MKETDTPRLDVNAETPTAFLRRFFEAMRQWELNASAYGAAALISAHEVDGELEDEANRKSMAELESVFAEFCTSRADRGIVYNEPPEYDPDAEVILEVRPLRTGVQIVTQQTNTGYNHKLLYTVLKRHGAWRLRGKRMIIEDDGSLEPWLL